MDEQPTTATLDYTLAVSETQLRLIAEALEFYTRFCIGQFAVPSIVEHRKLPEPYKRFDTYDRDRYEQLMLEIRAMFFPELRGPGHSFGVGWDEKPEQQQAQIGYEVYKWILHEFHKNNEHWNVHTSPPMLHYSDQPKPVVTKINPENPS